jgi:hypothetical protein
MLATDDGLYLGMANASNIATDLNDLNPEGGWELIRLTRAECGLSGTAGDMNGSGKVDWYDFAAFARCYTGFCQPGSCVLPLYEDGCCSAGDFSTDGDVDLVDLFTFLGILFGA